MSRIKYPIGIQDFPKLITSGFAYVDKTRFVGKLVEESQFLFLSRPRRFGKSLLLSTLEAYFQGRRDLFRGLDLDRMDVEWEEHPVIYLDFNNGLYDNHEGLILKIHSMLGSYERRYGLKIGECDRNALPLRFEELILAIFKQTGKTLVILVDEYDKPLLGIEKYKEVFEKNQLLLKAFYSNLKSMDRYIRFAFLTGVARFNKVSIFSDLNNLTDISLDNEYAEICGWTEEELVATFRQGISKLAEKRKEDFTTTLNELRTYYDGYRFTSEGERLYNPFSILNALREKEMAPFWFASGTPTVLVNRVKAGDIYPPSLDDTYCTREELTTVGYNATSTVALMFQTGYLSIRDYDPSGGVYRLQYPNKEVELSFYRDLLPAYAPITENPGSPFVFAKFRLDLHNGKPEDFMKRMATLFKNLPGEDHHESDYRAITFLLAILSGTTALAETHSYKGRSDLEVATDKYIYIFEFKYNKSVAEAMEQIHSRDYAGRYALDRRTIYLIGANYNEDKAERGLYYEIQLLHHDEA